MALLDAVVNGKLNIALPPGKRTIRIADVNAAFRDEPVAKHNNNVLQWRTRIILLGHAIDRDFSTFHAVHLNVDDEDFLVSANSVRRDSEGFTLVFKLPYHVGSSDPVVIVTQALSAVISRIVEMNGQAFGNEPEATARSAKTNCQLCDKTKPANNLHCRATRRQIAGIV